ncbi:MAG TPA: ADP-ribosylglycohydrolase family protein [Victivallales bacterium]|nr:ADP-ribosylglycohydrolase family protein [Victivallales bacterium]HRU01871.1 ADP-ribosylglycohydrolase family protein [Victivallales bacterium]
MHINEKEFHDKVLGCWIGKNIGGTLGAPFEWRRQVNSVEFYTQDLKGNPLPNDDLDIQLLWLVVMERYGLDFTANTLAEYWVSYITPHWAEYGTAKTNMRSGLVPPLSGTFENMYKHSCGSYIRSEIWACVSPGMPHVAVNLAIKDAILDHGDGEGTWAEVFTAALESTAFIEKDIYKLIEIALSYIPKDCGVAKAVNTVLKSYKSNKSWLQMRDEVLKEHRGGFTYMFCSEEDRKKGFKEGLLGYDVPSNIAFTIAALLYGGTDFGKVVCMAVNLGEDTDCTAATAGSIWGIIHGASAIPEKWLEPIGRSIATIVLDLGDIGWAIPKNVDELTVRTIRMAKQNLLRNNRDFISFEKPTDLSDVKMESLKCADNGANLQSYLKCTVHNFDLFTVYVDYMGMPVIKKDIPKKIRITIKHQPHVHQMNLSMHWYTPDSWTVLPSRDGYVLAVQSHLGGADMTFDFDFIASQVNKSINRAVLEITADGRPTVMLIPLLLLNGNLKLN